MDIENAVIKNKIDHGLTKDEEVKWNTKYSKIGLSLNEFLSYRIKIYEIINNLSETVIATIMIKKAAYKKPYINDHFDIYKNSLFYIMERVHYFLTQDLDKPEPTVFVLDNRKNDKEKNLDKMLASAYRRALGLGTYYTNFSHFSRTAFFSDSEDCIGIQLADHCAGPIYRMITDGKNDWYDLLLPKIRKIQW
ncbi:MAG: hypothetical protein PWQ60_1909 [Thermoanaerobacteraceae bacterium]|nr:hypothetical protein [Thermoanaerobacteraceae bacterium]